MVAFANQNALLLLDFEDSKYFEKHMEEISQGYGVIKTSNNRVLKLLKELSQYFKGKLTKFTVPVEFTGTDFQKKFGKNCRTSVLESTEVINLKPML